jgi:ribonucleoside-diphosphate reductase alpha chain
MTEIYLYAWEKELKSTYYCFIDKTVKGEKYTEKVNKRGERRGFGRAAAASGSDVVASTESDSDIAVEEKPSASSMNVTRADVEKMDLSEVERLARAKYGDAVVEQVKRGDTEACPVDPLLNKICPSCE